MNAESLHAESWDVQPVIEEVSVTPSTEAELRADLDSAHRTLRKIVRINPALFPGGPSNQNFGKRFVQGLQKAQAWAKSELTAQIQRETLREIEAYGDESSATAE